MGQEENTTTSQHAPVTFTTLKDFIHLTAEQLHHYLNVMATLTLSTLLKTIMKLLKATTEGNLLTFTDHHVV